MGVRPESFEAGDVYIFYDMEEVYFRFRFNDKTYFKKFAGESELACDARNGLLFEAIQFGEEITEDEYERG